jgi:hypothetical protein
MEDGRRRRRHTNCYGDGQSSSGSNPTASDKAASAVSMNSRTCFESLNAISGRQVVIDWSEHKSDGIRLVAVSRFRWQIRSHCRPPLIPDVIIDPMVLGGGD